MKRSLETTHLVSVMAEKRRFHSLRGESSFRFYLVSHLVSSRFSFHPYRNETGNENDLKT